MSIFFFFFCTLPLNAKKIKNDNVDPAVFEFLQTHAGLSQKYTQTFTFPRPPSKDIRAIIYGNHSTGYFKTVPTQMGDLSLTIRFNPPGYEEPIDFYALESGTNSSPKWIARHLFSNPTPTALQGLRGKIEGIASFPFVLLVGAFELNGAILNIPYILNRRGEIIWAHFLDKGETLFNYHLVFQHIRDDEYGILAYREQSYFESVRASGEVVHRVHPEKSKIPYPIHHDFFLDEKSGKLLTLGHRRIFVHYFPFLYEKDFNVFHNFPFLFAKPISFETNPLIEVDLEKNLSRVLWNPLDSFSPMDEKVQFGPEGIPENVSFQQLNEEIATNSRWSSWQEKKGMNIDWMHANSLSPIADGSKILISIRNFDRIVLFDRSQNSLLWTLGCDPNSSIKILNSRDCFSAQHHATMLDEKTIMIFDNHSSRSQMDDFNKLGSRILALRLNFSNRTAEKLWDFSPNEVIPSVARGSAYRLNNGNVFGFFPDEGRSSDEGFEFNPITKEVAAHVYFERGTPNSGYRAEPRYSIGREEFWGWEL